MSKKIIFLTLFLSLFLFSCGKTSEKNISNSWNIEKISLLTWKIDSLENKDFEEKGDFIIYKDNSDFFEISFPKDFEYSKRIDSEGIIFMNNNSGIVASTLSEKNNFSSLDEYLKDYIEKSKALYSQITKNEFEINWVKWYKINLVSYVWEIEMFSEQYFFENKDRKIIWISFSNLEKNFENNIIKTFKFLK